MMRNLIAICYLLSVICCADAAVFTHPSGTDSNTVYSIAVTAAGTVGGSMTTPWATSYNIANSRPQMVWSTEIQSSNGFYNAFPTACIDRVRGQIIAAWSSGTNHTQAYTGVPVWSFSADAVTWSTPEMIPLPYQATNATGWSCAHAGISALRDGTLLLVEQRRFEGGDSGAYNVVWQRSPSSLEWTTNSILTDGVGTSSILCSDKVHEMPDGGWIAHTWRLGATYTNAVHVSRNRGASWTTTVVGVDNANETSFSFAPNGSIHLDARSSSLDPVIFRTWISTNMADSWTGPFTNAMNFAGGGTNVVATFPHTCFAGNRKYVTIRQSVNNHHKLLFADDAPYYTNYNSEYVVFAKPSSYCDLVALSESVLLLVGSAAVDYIGQISYAASTNSAIFASVIAEAGQGFSSLPLERDLPRPYIALSHRDLPIRGTVTNWINRGSATVSEAVSNSAPSVIFTNGFPCIAKPFEAAGGVIGLLLGDTSTLGYFHTTNRFTVMWRGVRTNTGNYATIVNCANTTSDRGLKVLWNSSGVLVFQGRATGGTWGGSYTIPGLADSLAKFGTYCLVAENETLKLYFDGMFINEVANTGGAGYSATATTSIVPKLLYKTDGTADQGVFMSDLYMWQEPLTPGQVAAWSARINQ